AAGPDVLADQRGEPRPRRVPGAAAVVGFGRAVRFQPARLGDTVAPAAFRLGRAHGRRPAGRPGLDAGAVPGGPASPTGRPRPRRYRVGVARLRPRGALVPARSTDGMPGG